MVVLAAARRGGAHRSERARPIQRHDASRAELEVKADVVALLRLAALAASPRAAAAELVVVV